MAINTGIDTTEALVHLLQEGMEYTINKIVTDYIEDAKKKLEQAIPEITSSIALRVWQSVSLERFGHDLKITVDLRGGDKNG